MEHNINLLEIGISPELLEEHRLAAIALKAAKANELHLRLLITDNLLDGLATGTHNFSCEGLKVKAVKGVNHKFDVSTLNELLEEDHLSVDERSLIRWKPELKLADYKKAEFNVESLEEALIVTPSLPSLEIKLGD